MTIDDFTELHAGAHGDDITECCALEAAAMVRVGHKESYRIDSNIPDFVYWNDSPGWDSPAHRASVMIPVIKVYWDWKRMDQNAVHKRLTERLKCSFTYTQSYIILMVNEGYTHEQIAEVLINAAG